MARRRGKKRTSRPRAKPMIKVRAMAETYMGLNLVTQNLLGGNPLQVLVGDLNTSGGTGALATLMGPQPGVITIKELVTGSMNMQGSSQAQTASWAAAGFPSGGAQTSIMTAPGSPLEAVSQNFQNNVGNIVVGGFLQTAGWRIFNKVIGKSANKANKMLRSAGLGSTIQI